MPDQKAQRAAWQVLTEIEDPELPISITDLGLIKTVEVLGATARIRIIPTFSACPAIDMIRRTIVARMSALPGVDKVEVELAFDEPWTMARMSEEGRRRLFSHGLSVPRRRAEEPTVCPFCGSTNTTLENPFGPTLCRAIYYCRDCRNPIERFKPPAE